MFITIFPCKVRSCSSPVSGSRPLGVIQALTTAALLKGSQPHSCLWDEETSPFFGIRRKRTSHKTIKYVYCGTKEKRIIAFFFGFALKQLTFLF